MTEQHGKKASQDSYQMNTAKSAHTFGQISLHFNLSNPESGIWGDGTTKWNKIPLTLLKLCELQSFPAEIFH